MKNNFCLAIAQLILMITLVLLTKKFHPLKLLKVRAIIFLICMPSSIYLLNNITTSSSLSKIQLLLVMTSITTSTAVSILYKNFPIFKRFTFTTLIYAFSSIFIYVVTSFGIAYLVNMLGTYGILLIMIPVGVAFYWGVTHFESLEKVRYNY
ncbi:hypothetical protein [Rickettsia felis]|nr:hypothetical protein [Rickettsia felis]